MISDFKIETERLLIRPFELSDIDSSYKMNLDPEVSRLTGDGGVIDRNEMRRRIEEDVLGDYKKYGFGRFAVELKESNRFIGFAGLKYLADIDEVDLGYRFIKECWGKGIATEAGQACLQYGFEELNLEKVLGLVLPKNIASIRVLEKLGFKYDKEFFEDGLLVHQYLLNKKSG